MAMLYNKTHYTQWLAKPPWYVVLPTILTHILNATYTKDQLTSYVIKKKLL